MRSFHLIAMLALICSTVHAEDKSLKTVSDVAKKADRPAGAPKYADVCFRYGWIRGSGDHSVENAKEMIQAFHATRVDWFYTGTHTGDDGVPTVSTAAKAFIDWCHANDMKIGGAINNNTRKVEWKYKKHHLDRYVGEPGNPDFIADVLARGKAQIDAGVDTMVCDDIFKYDAPRQKLWSDIVLAKLKAYKPGFTIAGNNGGNIGTDYVRKYAVDFHYSDNNFVPTPSKWWAASKAHRAVSSAILLHPNRPITKNVRRTMIALAYANGAHVITPWDEYIHGKDRLFGDPADFADLYGFARALGQQGYLNGYEDAAVGGYDLTENRYGDKPPIAVSGGSGKLSVFGRAKPGDPDAQIVFHLVESGKPTPCKVKIRISALPTDRMAVALARPPAYDKAVHDRAEESKDYSSLSVMKALTKTADGEWLVVEVPAVESWGVLVLSRMVRARKRFHDLR